MSEKTKEEGNNDEIEQKPSGLFDRGVSHTTLINGVVWCCRELFLTREGLEPVSLHCYWTKEMGEEIAKELGVPFSVE
jgi:hypothetical protein